MNATSDVLAERELADLGRGTVGDDLAGFDLVAERTIGFWFWQVRSLRPRTCGVRTRRRCRSRSSSESTKVTSPARGRDDHARVGRRSRFHAGRDQRRIGLDQRHRLTLHVRAHQRAVGVVMLEERDQRGGDADHLLRRDVHVLDFAARRRGQVAVLASRAGCLRSCVHRVDRRSPARGPLQFLVGAEQSTLLVTLPLFDLAVRRLEEAVLVDLRVDASDAIRPMFVPSGVSIGQMRP